MKISIDPRQTFYVDFSRRMIYRKKSLWLRLANKFHFFEILIGLFALLDIYIFLLILFAL